MRKLEKIKVNCLFCGKEREVLQSYINRGGGRYCNRVCVGKACYIINKEKFNYDRRGKNSPNYGRHFSQEWKDNISKNHADMSGDKNPGWKGDDAKYGTKHDWIERKLGKPNKCEKCGTTEYHRYEWANRSRTYKRIVEDWIRLCVPCHRKADYHKLPL